MKRSLAGCVALLLVSLAVLLWLRGGAGAPSTISIPGESPTGSTVAAEQQEKAAAALELGPETERQLVDLAADAPKATLRGRVVRAEDRLPLAGCEVRLSGHRHGPVWLEQHMTLDGYLAFDPVDFGDAEPVRTGPDGTFAFTFAPPRGNWFKLRFHADGRIPMQARFDELAPEASEDLGDVVMAWGCAVRGEVVDTKGEPQPGVELSMWRDHSPPFVRDARIQFVTSARVTSGPGGSFAFAQNFLQGSWTLYTRDRQKVEPYAVVIDKGQTEATVRVVLLRPEEVEFIAGRVVDEQGAGVTEARVSGRMTTMNPMGTTTLADGSFRLERRLQDPRGPLELTASAIGRESARQPGVHWGTRNVQFLLKSTLAVTLVVRNGSSGVPVERYAVRRVDQGLSSWPLRHRGNHPGGEVRLTNLRRGRHSVVVVPMAPALLPSSIRSFTVADGPSTGVEVLVYPPAARTVEVRRRDGSAVAGAKVELLEPGERPVALATWSYALDSQNRNTSFMARLLADGTTGADGNVTLQGPPEPLLTARVSGPGHRAVVIAELRWRAAEGPLRVEVDAGATLTGQLRPQTTIRDYWQAVGHGREVPDAATLEQWARYHAPRLELSRTVGGRNEHFPPFALGPALVARDGTFTITGIPPGTWRIVLEHTHWNDWRSRQTRSHYLGTVVDLRDGETRRFDAALGRDLPALLHGTVTIDGQPLRESSVYLHCTLAGGGKSAVLGKTNGRGQFHAQLDPGTWRATVALAVGGALLPVAGKFTVEPGQELNKMFKLRTGQLQLRLVRGDARTPVAGVPVLAELPASRWCRWLPTTDQGGSTRLDQLPLQSLRLRCRPAHLASSDAWDSWLRAHPDDWRDVLLDLGEVDLSALAVTKELAVPPTAGY